MDGEENQQGAPSVSSVSKRVFVGNLAWKTEWWDLKDHFKTIGEVKYADVFTDFNKRSRGCGIVEYERDEDAQKAIAELNDSDLDGRKIFVREDRDDVQERGGERGTRGRGRGGARGGGRGFSDRAASGDDAQVSGGRGRGRYNAEGGDRPQRQGRQEPTTPTELTGKQVFVKNLPYDTQTDDLVEHFKKSLNVSSAEVAKDSSGKSRGFGTVLFETAEDAQNAITSFSNTDFQGRQIQVTIDRFA
ncbi:RNA-binding protein [Acrasis kona]|uniref:RNA-binding protein n=1 Tax=Acrasis kona TaxID=1008807 RepID=A0AAW2ZLH9_9EUKA